MEYKASHPYLNAILLEIPTIKVDQKLVF